MIDNVESKTQDRANEQRFEPTTPKIEKDIKTRARTPHAVTVTLFFFLDLSIIFGESSLLGMNYSSQYPSRDGVCHQIKFKT